PGVLSFAEQAKWNVMAAHDAIIASRVDQSFHANKRRSEAPLYQVGDLAYLSTRNLSLPKGRAKKLVPKFIGPYQIIEVHGDSST
ncbi:hypothetical protein SISNIDRAFT_389356, partial [Sistotremastrum niveocremeum HHB9708]